MLCENCGKNTATTHIKRVINNVVSEYHLCSECATKYGFTDIKFSDFNPFMLSDLWGSLFNNTASPKRIVKRCEKCGSSFDDIAQKGKLGCPECYITFYDELMPALYKIHGKTQHVGLTPLKKGEQKTQKSKIEQLKEELQKAIENEQYEQAAKIRDKIRMIERGEGHE